MSEEKHIIAQIEGLEAEFTVQIEDCPSEASKMIRSYRAYSSDYNILVEMVETFDYVLVDTETVHTYSIAEQLNITDKPLFANWAKLTRAFDLTKLVNKVLEHVSGNKKEDRVILDSAGTMINKFYENGRLTIVDISRMFKYPKHITVEIMKYFNEIWLEVNSNATSHNTLEESWSK